MSLKQLNERIESSELYQFSQRHKKVINIIQGLVIIGLLISINIYVVKDHFIKKQIAENCGYTTSKYSCICEQNYVKNWQDIQNNKINLSVNYTNV
jgi:hypothetical protein